MSRGLTSWPAVAELQGLYGPFIFPERILQRIWLEKDFTLRGLTLADGRSLAIETVGTWNRLGGPDFKRARLVMGGEKVVGDVEIHLHESSWEAHAHASDPAYREVVLHVVLFPTDVRVTAGVEGREIPILVLLPFLSRGLEDYADEDAIERIANRSVSRAIESWLQIPLEVRRARLWAEAQQRWEQKVRFAEQRIARWGWDEACHHTALEILGYRFNRVPMLRLAGAWPLDLWRRGGVDLQEVYFSESARWSTQGTRPANHPYRRLDQYARWNAARPDWTRHLRILALPVVDAAEGRGGSIRRRGRWTALRQTWAADLTGEVLTGSRWDTLICDGWLPLLATVNPGWGSFWMQWFPGDLPPHVGRSLRQMGVISRAQPLCHGLAQGLIGWWFRQERPAGATVGQASVPVGGGA